MSTPKKNTAYIFDIALVDVAGNAAFKSNPTIATGDFKVSTDNGALANLATLPAVNPASSIIVKVSLSASEMNGDKIMIQCIDAAGSEWGDAFIFLDTTTQTIDDMVNLTAAQVNTEVVDALNVDTYAEPGQGVPAATTSIAAKIGYLYKFLRNKTTQTSTTLSVFDDAGSTVDQKSTVSDDGTTATRNEIASGP